MSLLIKGPINFIWEIFHQHCCIIIVLCICVYLMEPFLCWAMWSIGFYLFSICTCTLKQHYISWMQFTCNITVFIWKVDFHEFKMKHFNIELTLKSIECKYYVSHWSRVIDTSILLKYFFQFVIEIKIWIIFKYKPYLMQPTSNAALCRLFLSKELYTYKLIHGQYCQYVFKSTRIRQNRFHRFS